MLSEADVPTRVVLHVVSAFAPERMFEVARVLFRSAFAMRYRTEFSALLAALGADPVETGILLVLRAIDGQRRTPPELEKMLNAKHADVNAALDAMAFGGHLEYRCDWRRDAMLRVGLSEHGRGLAECLLLEYARGMKRLAVILPDDERAALEAVGESVIRALKASRMPVGGPAMSMGG